MDTSLWLVGTGPMAEAYALVLNELGISYRVIGRGLRSAETFYQATGVAVKTGGLKSALASLPTPHQAIVAVGIDQLVPTAQLLLLAGCRKLLVEKPGSITFSGLNLIHTLQTANDAKVWIAYNRRFYASVEKLRALVAEDGGITSVNFEFTEWSHRIRDLEMPTVIKENWLLANSTHVIDLAFHLIGLPDMAAWQSWHSGELDWHPVSARFHGAGLSEQRIPFSYHADWESSGRWGLDVLTRSGRYVLRPLEALHCIPLGSVVANPIQLDDLHDKNFKPGLFNQCLAFLYPDRVPLLSIHLCPLVHHLKAFRFYCNIAGYEF